MLADFDPLRDYLGVGITLWGLLLGISFIVAMVDRKKRINQPMLQFILANLIFGPYLLWLTFWCYANGERLENDPDGWMSDMRVLWPLFTIIDAIGFVIVAYGLRQKSPR